ncbi:MAG: UDP-N-acetylmuramoyl-L-alanyl-D-glutamate--2,6-diaminopimelate ligase [Candidatus Electrothrix sp. AW2]|jgi:UDP-N-acetylmuramoyl-L-alanyl-D-glutamate--2,6-diaminopimelate ligase|nr:UDP-N-acetylmuramoyl-L-alanyl-D-glutamate--2,6-diaminopimelate ligase [Candidatus Electrothrix gigas]MCI5136250.1 UDP-N-acetylmuramoyl-L-alanyl-D-glutamate--2,6-diaminopimelate ligase [Candidatus Electrothrix gigas]MCI5178355.1 UDP-N-acetylmuramoyl-L-alanyl-D-glutamate--2,6-diaminopimelate ligase [Candidatus Electrothrix gigas]MCI5189214.1 UDP-N-acetylmuramoyl-L-alanyl-D-glutamate--2,6-diaminopimelate ligase [Candidatus Electrothrix gigas]MCI5193325.1 UDP-N-acetylmuramoyl-L-alanyl-D-glutamat
MGVVLDNPQGKITAPLLDHTEHPSHKLYVIGITGTNGKTTVAHLLGEVLKEVGYKPFVLGTLNSGNKDLSTPEPLDILKFMNDHLEQGGTHFVMEVTSEGIDQERIKHIDFDVKVLTNITHDHLDYHKTFQRYEAVKQRFMAEGDAHKIYPANFAETSVDFKTKLVGDFNLLNMKAAVTVLRHIGISEKYICEVLSSCRPPRGRLENVEAGQKFMVLIDYAHTPDALQNALFTVKKIAKHRNGRLLLLFGCGGNRDKGKRVQMGRIAGEISDFFVVTDDNPRLEESQTIMDEIVQGIDLHFYDYVLIQDRRKAIEFIVNKAEGNDVIILAGKGHETYQVLKTETIYFDDQEEVTKAILHRLTKECSLNEHEWHDAR